MKPLLVSVITLLLIFAGVCFDILYINHFVEETLQLIDETVAFADDEQLDAAIERFKAVEERLDKMEVYLSVVVLHDEIDDLYQSRSKASEYLKRSELTDFFAEAKSLRLLVEHIRGLEEISMENIL